MPRCALLCSAVFSLKVLSLQQLSDRGVKHLEADVKYLTNVFHALDLAAPPVLEHLGLLAALGKDEAATHLAQETVAGETDWTEQTPSENGQDRRGGIV